MRAKGTFSHVPLPRAYSLWAKPLTWWGTLSLLSNSLGAPTSAEEVVLKQFQNPNHLDSGMPSSLLVLSLLSHLQETIKHFVLKGLGSCKPLNSNVVTPNHLLMIMGYQKRVMASAMCLRLDYQGR